MTITEFLEARFDEDERFTYNPALMPVSGPGLSDLVKRARADIAAKRAIVAEHTCRCPDPDCGDCGACSGYHHADPTPAPCTTIRLLLQPFAEHADFDEGWKP